MFIRKLGNAVIGTTKTAAYVAKKHSPEILVGAGIALGAAATVTACVQTTKLEPVIDDIQEALDDVRLAHENGECTNGEHVANLLRAYAYGVKEVGKLYWMPFTLGLGSIASILGGFNILNKRHAALLAAYSSLEKSYDTLYNRVKDEFSQTAADNFAAGVAPEEVMVNGKKKTADIQHGDTLGKYEWLYCPDCRTYYENGLYAEETIKARMIDANRRILQTKDTTVTVAEILADWGEFDIPREFLTVGWHMPWDWVHEHTENYIQWTWRPVYKFYDDEPKLCWIINFNCDGDVYNDVWKKGMF